MLLYPSRKPNQHCSSVEKRTGIKKKKKKPMEEKKMMSFLNGGFVKRIFPSSLSRVSIVMWEWWHFHVISMKSTENALSWDAFACCGNLLKKVFKVGTDACRGDLFKWSLAPKSALTSHSLEKKSVDFRRKRAAILSMQSPITNGGRKWLSFAVVMTKEICPPDRIFHI